MTSTSKIDPRNLHGFVPESPYADLFVKVFQLTLPGGVVGESSKRPAQFVSTTSIQEEIEDGEIDVNDNLISTTKEEMIAKKDISKVAVLNPNPKRNPVVIEGTLQEQSGSGYHLPPLHHPPHVLPLEAQIQLDRDPDRLSWLENLMEFLSSQGTPLQYSPTVPGLGQRRHPLDLYRLYQEVEQQGGFISCCFNFNNTWKVVAKRINVPVAKSFVLKKIYNKNLRAFEKSDKQSGSSSTVGLNNFDSFSEETTVNSSPEGGKHVGVKGRLGLKGQRVSVKARLGNKTQNY